MDNSCDCRMGVCELHQAFELVDHRVVLRKLVAELRITKSFWWWMAKFSEGEAPGKLENTVLLACLKSLLYHPLWLCP